MITRIEAKNFRALRYVNQQLDNFHVLVGANASGKTTFLDVISFVADLIKDGVDQAIFSRSSNFKDLTFSSLGGDIEVAVEARLPPHIYEKLGLDGFDTIRYEICIGLTDETAEHSIKEERTLLLNSSLIDNPRNGKTQRTLFPENKIVPPSLTDRRYPKKSYRLVIKKNRSGNDNFYPETPKVAGKGYMPSFKLGIKRSALGNLPADETKFPAATWLKSHLISGIQEFVLDSRMIRKASPPGQSTRFKTDGSNLPWVISALRQNKRRFSQWISHLQTALPDVIDIDTVEREDDKHRYLRIHYSNNIVVPSWLVSDGTLRLLALTIPAYLSEFAGVYLIEEPENGIHPKAIETIFQSLSSVYNAQLLLASHSPVILGMVALEDVLCFAKTKDGATDIVRGDEHPRLQDWKGDVNLSTLYASGVLG